MSILTVSSKGQIVLPAALRRKLGMGAGAKIEALEEADGVKLRVLRPIQNADVAKFAGMAKLPATGAPRRLEDSDPASLLRRPRRDDDQWRRSTRTYWPGISSTMALDGFAKNARRISEWRRQLNSSGDRENGRLVRLMLPSLALSSIAGRGQDR